MLTRLLLVTEDAPTAARLRRVIGDSTVVVEEAIGSSRMWEALARDTFDLLLLGRHALPEAAAEVVSTLRRLPDGPDIIVLQRDEDPQERARILTAGCLAVLNLGLDDQLLGDTLRAVIARGRPSNPPPSASGESQFRLDDFSAHSAAMRGLIDVAERVARSDASILILGETGVGKEWLARAIHGASGRATGPFQAVNCAAVPESLLESELFGHEKGAFTGAHRAHRGHFEMAHRGTVFLDEIADMPVHLQSKLLRVLAERQIQRVGAERPLMIDVRVLAATNRDMVRALAERTFRDDLYYRLSVVTLEVPPLRDRREDIVPLAHGYLEHFGRQLGRPDVQIRQDALDALTRYAWPGNVRELINVVERAVLLCRGRLITPADLPPAVTRELDHLLAENDPPRATGEEVLFPPRWLDLDLPDFRRRLVDGAEPAYLAHQLRQTAGRIGDTAKRIGIDTRSLYDRMRRYGLRKEDFKKAR